MAEQKPSNARESLDHDNFSIFDEDLCDDIAEVIESETGRHVLALFNRQHGTRHTFEDVVNNPRVRGEVLDFAVNDARPRMTPLVGASIVHIVRQINDILEMRDNSVKQRHMDHADELLFKKFTPLSFEDDQSQD